MSLIGLGHREEEPVANTAINGGGHLQGWTMWQMDLPADAPATLRFVRCVSMQLFAAVAFLLIATAACWKAATRPALLVSLLGIFGAAAMLLPVAYVPIASAGVLGILFCLAWRWVRGSLSAGHETTTSNGPPAKPTPGSTVTVVGRLGLALLGVLLTPPSGDAARAETPPPMYRVLVPINDQKKPTGGRVYLPETFYQQLYRSAAAEKPQGWMILNAAYRGVLAAEPVSGRLTVDTLRAQYDVQVFGRDVRVRLPLYAEGVNLSPNGVLLDGRPIEWQWEPDAREKEDVLDLYALPDGPFRQLGTIPLFPPSLAFQVAEPGQYRLEVALRPSTHNLSGADGFDVAIPRVAESRLELQLPDGVRSVEVPSAAGVVRLEQKPPRLLADLGPADRLTVRWAEGTASGAARPAIDAENFLWLKVRPGSVVIDARFKLRVAEGRIQQVQLVTDPRLRLLPLSGENPPAVHVGPESGQSRLITFRWPRPLSGQATLEASFLLSGAMGVGNFHLPQIELRDARAAKRWMAVSVDPVLDREEQKKQRLEPVAVSDFLEAGARPRQSRKWPTGCPTGRLTGASRPARTSRSRRRPNADVQL